MKPRKRSLFIMLLCFEMVFVLSACSAVSKPTGSKPAEKVQVTYWHTWTGDAKKLMDSIVTEFNNTHPNIQVNAVSIVGDANAKFLTAQAGGDPPDVMTQYNQVVPSWAEKGAILSLQKFIQTDAPDMQSWLYPVAAQISSYKGELYAIPFAMNSYALIYNKDVFREVGLDPEKPPKTIQELDAMQDKLWKMDDRGFVQRVGFMPSKMTLWIPSFAGQWTDNSGKPTAAYENNLKALQWFQSYSKKFDATKVASFNKSMTSNVNSASPFLTGKVVFDVNGMWKLVDLKKYAPEMKYGVVPLPYPEGYGKENATWVNGNYNIIPEKAKHPKEAWEFIKWLTGYKNEAWAAKMLPQGGWIPASPKITEQADYQTFINEIPARQQFVDLMKSKNGQITPVIPDQQYYWDRIKAAEDSVMTGGVDPKQALDVLQKEVEAEIAKNSKK